MAWGALPHLKDVFGHARQAVIGDGGGAGADADLPHLVRLTQVGRAVHPHHTHQSCGGDTSHRTSHYLSAVTVHQQHTSHTQLDWVCLYVTPLHCKRLPSEGK